MELKKAQRALRYVAKKYGISEAEVVAEIEHSIEDALDTVQRENNQAAMARWKEIPCAGVVPTAYELVAYLGEKLMM